MATIVKAPNPVPSYDSLIETSVFLAGSIDQDKAVHWQKVVEGRLNDLDVILFNPRRDVWDAGLTQDISNPDFVKQVEWELDCLDAATFVIFYFDPNGLAPVTMLELGHYADKAFVCCPPGYWRRGNVQIFCKRNHIMMLDSLDDLIDHIRNLVLGRITE